MVENCERFSGLDQAVALKLIRARKGRFVVGKLEQFSGLNHKKIALELILMIEAPIVAENLEKFS